jgi:NAD(P)-dependent dehydrogenase (short-subunit alcohol dehydrogenase family)
VTRQTTGVAVVTGASSGIGKEAAKALAAQGWHVIAHGRDAKRSATAEADIRAAAASGARIDMVRGDLCSLADTARLADGIKGLTDRIDVLLNNAGGMRDHREITSEGNEITFAGNHLGHFLLTKRLLPLLRNAVKDGEPGAVRIVNVSSRAHEFAPPIDWDDLQQIKAWSSHESYGNAKLANILFTRELAKRLSPEGLVVQAMHPGTVDTNFSSHGTAVAQEHLAKMPKISAGEGADTLFWLATAPEAGKTSGLYFYNREAIPPSAAASDDANAARLWADSEALLARAGF